MNIGSYAPGAAAYVTLRLAIAPSASEANEPSRWYELSPVVTVLTDNGTKHANLTVTVIR